MDRDFAENHDLAAQERGRLVEMIALWYVEAAQYNVLPLDGRLQQRFAEERPAIAKDRRRYDYYPGTQPAPPILNRPHTITAVVEIPKDGAEGVLVSQGGADGGLALFVRDRRLRYTYNYVADQYFSIAADSDLPSGRHALSVEFAPTAEPDVLKGRGAPGTLEPFVDGRRVGGGTLPVTVPHVHVAHRVALRRARGRCARWTLTPDSARRMPRISVSLASSAAGVRRRAASP